MKEKWVKFTTLLAPLTAFVGSCCAIPLLLLSLGVGSAGFATAIAPYRIYLIGVTLLFLGIAFYLVYGRKACEGNLCRPQAIRRTKILLWIATGVVFLFLVGPHIAVRFIS